MICFFLVVNDLDIVDVIKVEYDFFLGVFYIWMNVVISVFIE